MRRQEVQSQVTEPGHNHLRCLLTQWSAPDRLSGNRVEDQSAVIRYLGRGQTEEPGVSDHGGWLASRRNAHCYSLGGCSHGRHDSGRDRLVLADKSPVQVEQKCRVGFRAHGSGSVRNRASGDSPEPAAKVELCHGSLPMVDV